MFKCLKKVVNFFTCGMCCKEKRNQFKELSNGNGSVNKVNEETSLLPKNPMESEYTFSEKHNDSSLWGKIWSCLTAFLNSYACGTIGMIFLVVFTLLRELCFKQIGSSSQILPLVEEILGNKDTAASIRCFNYKGIPYCSEVVKAFNDAKEIIGAILAWFELGIQSTEGTWPFIAFPLVSWLAPYLFGAAVDFVEKCLPSPQDEKDLSEFKKRKDLKDPRKGYLLEKLLFRIVKDESVKKKVLKENQTKRIIYNDAYKVVPRAFLNYGLKGSMLFTAVAAAVVLNRLYFNYWYGRLLGSEEWQTKKDFLYKVIVNLWRTNIDKVANTSAIFRWLVEKDQSPYGPHADYLIDGVGIVYEGENSLAIDNQKYVKDHVFDDLLKKPGIGQYIDLELLIDILAALIFILIPGLASKYFNSKSKYLTREMNKNAFTHTSVQLQDKQEKKPPNTLELGFQPDRNKNEKKDKKKEVIVIKKIDEKDKKKDGKKNPKFFGKKKIKNEKTKKNIQGFFETSSPSRHRLSKLVRDSQKDDKFKKQVNKIRKLIDKTNDLNKLKNK